MFVIQNTATKLVVGPKNQLIVNPMMSNNYRKFSLLHRAEAALKTFRRQNPDLAGDGPLGKWVVVPLEDVAII